MKKSLNEKRRARERENIYRYNESLPYRESTGRRSFFSGVFLYFALHVVEESGDDGGE